MVSFDGILLLEVDEQLGLALSLVAGQHCCRFDIQLRKILQGLAPCVCVCPCVCVYVCV